jgi:hypothetical protein
MLSISDTSCLTAGMNAILLRNPDPILLWTFLLRLF